MPLLSGPPSNPVAADRLPGPYLNANHSMQPPEERETEISQEAKEIKRERMKERVRAQAVSAGL